jgi:hypothetical protein
MNSAKPRRTRASVACVVFLAGMVAPIPTSAQNVIPVSEWQDDLRYLATQIPKIHPHPFHRISRDQFESAVSAVEGQALTLSDHEIIVAFARLVAMLGEGHSRVSLPGLPDPMSDVSELTPAAHPRLEFHRLPVKLYSFSDGLFVVAATPEFSYLIGASVLQVGDRSAQAALDAVQPIVNRDNEMGLKLVAPDLVVVPEILHAMHVIPDTSRVALSFRSNSGKMLGLEIAPLPPGAQPALTEIYDTSIIPLPLYLHHGQKNYWAEYLADSKTVFVRIHVIQDSAGESVAKFAREVGSLVAFHPTDRLVIDLRGCHGGDNQMFRSLLLGLIRDTRIDLPGKVFTIIDRGTFSAAVNAASDLEHLTNSIFVGEPTSGAPSSWGDPRRIILPHSGLIARISTIYWRDSTPDESRPWIAPDIPAPISSTDYFAGRDPAMEAILHFPLQLSFGDVLENVVRAGGGIESIVRLYYLHKTDPASADQPTEQAMQRLGAQLLSTRSYREALLVFELNFRDYPSSLSGAMKAVQKAQSSDPNDNSLADLARKLAGLIKHQ